CRRRERPLGCLVPKHTLLLPIPDVQNQSRGETVRPPLDLRHPAPEAGLILTAAAGAQGKQKERGQQKAPFLHVVHSYQGLKKGRLCWGGPCFCQEVTAWVRSW